LLEQVSAVVQELKERPWKQAQKALLCLIEMALIEMPKRSSNIQCVHACVLCMFKMGINLNGSTVR